MAKWSGTGDQEAPGELASTGSNCEPRPSLDKDDTSTQERCSA